MALPDEEQAMRDGVVKRRPGGWAAAGLAAAGLAAAWAYWARLQPGIDRETAQRLGRS